MKSKPRILMFAPLCYPPAGSEAIAASKLILAMIEAGWEVDVICQSDFGHYYPFTSDGFWDPVKKIVMSIPALGNMKLFSRFGPLIGKRNTGSFQSLLWAAKAVQIGLYLISRKKYDVIMSRATPLYGHLPPLFLSKKSGLPWIANWSDPLPSIKAPPPYGHGATAQVSIYKDKYCNAVAKNADWHTFPCDRLRSYMSTYLPYIRGKSYTIPHIALRRFQNKKLTKSSRFLACHAGSLANRDLSIFLEGVKLFIEKIQHPEKILFRFIGLEIHHFRKYVNQIGLERYVSFESPKTYEESNQIMVDSNVLLLIESPTEEGIFFPSKFVDYIQTGRPIFAISPRTGTINDIISTYGGGIASDCTSRQDICEGLFTLYESWQGGRLDDRYGSSALFDIFDEKAILPSYEKLLAPIISDNQYGT